MCVLSYAWVDVVEPDALEVVDAELQVLGGVTALVLQRELDDEGHVVHL